MCCFNYPIYFSILDIGFGTTQSASGGDWEVVALQEKRCRYCRAGTEWFTCTTQPQLYFLPILLLNTKVTSQQQQQQQQKKKQTNRKTKQNKKNLQYLNTALGVSDVVLLPLAHRIVSCYFLCQHRTWTPVKCFEFEPGRNFLSFFP